MSVCHAARVIDLTRSLRHLAWADARLFEDLAALPPEALQARYAPEAWTVGNLAMHIVGGAEWYAYCLDGEQWTDLAIPETAADLRALAARLADLDAILLAQAALPDETVDFIDEEGPRSAQRSTMRGRGCARGDRRSRSSRGSRHPSGHPPSSKYGRHRAA